MALTFNQQKIAERLKILTDQTNGIKARIYNIKKACSDPKSKPSFLSDRSVEGALKTIVKKFPAVDVRSGGASMQHVHQIRAEILKCLQLYYFTFVELLDLRDHINELLTTIDACQVQFDISLNTQLTADYLDLVTSYVCLMILLSRVDDRKAVLGLYTAAYDMQHGNSEPSFPRLGQLIMDYEVPLRKLSEEFIPHHRVLYSAIASLRPIYQRRNVSADALRESQFLSLSAHPNQLLFVTQTETVHCEYLSLDKMERWIIYGLLVCHNALGNKGVVDMWNTALHGSLVTEVCRDEVILTHSYIQQFLEGIKGYAKKVSDVKELYARAASSAAQMHRERRKFLRAALREMVLLFSDQPGLLGPKILFVWLGLSFARDEVSWLVRHADHWPMHSAKSKLPDDLTDRMITELIFYMVELKGLIEKYTQVIQRYYVQYLSGYDAIAISELIQDIPNCPEEEAVILSSTCNSIADLSPEELAEVGIAENGKYDFRGLRLDSCRFQAYTTCGKSPLQLSAHPKLACLLNTVVFHTKMVDFLDAMLIDTGDLSIFCFYARAFEEWFNQCIEAPLQAKYLLSYPIVCGDFVNSCHDMCPEEKGPVGERGLTLCNLFLDTIAKEIKNLLTNCAEQHCLLADTLLPKKCARLLSETIEQKKKSEKKTAKSGTADRQQTIRPVVALPGEESYLRTRENMTMMDKLHSALSMLCTAMSYTPTIEVWGYTFAPREYLTQHLETRFNKTVKGMVMYNADRSEIAKPSELLSSIRAFMTVLQSVENYVSIDVTRIFNNVLLQQSQSQDSYGDDTITALYTKWYLEVLLRRVSCSQVLFSSQQISFLLQEGPENNLHFNPQEYTDFNELVSLSELIGPYGVKFLCERLTWHVASQVAELKKLVVGQKEILRAIRTNYDNRDKMKELTRELWQAAGPGGSGKGGEAADSFLQRLTIIGEILSFRDLLQSALHHVLEERIPFLLDSIDDLYSRLPSNHPDILPVYEMADAAGIRTPVDATLVNALKARPDTARAPDDKVAVSPEEDYLHSCLLMVYIAVSLPRLANQPQSVFRASINAHQNNVHCIPLAINEVAGALFAHHGKGDTKDRMREFLALASGSLLRLGEGAVDRNAQPNTESTYILLDQLVESSPHLGIDLLQSCFPYVLLRSAYHCVYKQEHNAPSASRN